LDIKEDKMVEKKKGKLSRAVVWCFTKPIIKIAFITDEEKVFLDHANRFLDPNAIKPEHRKKGE
jgi:hypothetical protein